MVRVPTVWLTLTLALALALAVPWCDLSHIARLTGRLTGASCLLAAPLCPLPALHYYYTLTPPPPPPPTPPPPSPPPSTSTAFNNTIQKIIDFVDSLVD